MGVMGNNGQYAALLAALSQQGQGNQGATGFTQPGGLPTTQGGVPQLPQLQRQMQGGGGMPMQQGTQAMPQGASAQPQNPMAGMMNNPQLMQLLMQHAQQNGGNPSVAGGTAGIGQQGQAGGMSGADANTMRSQLQGGQPGTEMISPQFQQQMSQMGQGGMPAWLKQMMGGGGQ